MEAARRAPALITIGGPVDDGYAWAALETWVDRYKKPRQVIVTDAMGVDWQTLTWANVRGYDMHVIACAHDPAIVAAAKLVYAEPGDHLVAFPGHFVFVKRGDGRIALCFPGTVDLPGPKAVPIPMGVVITGPGGWEPGEWQPC